MTDFTTSIIAPMRRWLMLLGFFLLIGCAPAGNTAVETFAPALSPATSPTPDPQFRLHVHPEGPLYIGDQVSFEVIAPTGFDMHEKKVEVRLGDQLIGTADFTPYGIAGRRQATFWWVWDTSALEAGTQRLSFSVTPDGPTWQQAVRLSPRNALPVSEQEAHWEWVETQCCIINYISGTDAARDIADLAKKADSLYESLAPLTGDADGEKVPVVIMSRTLGHGGFTNGAIYVSYLDRNYAGSTFEMVLHHELVHWLDHELGGDLRPTLLLEGLAVYEAGGHFKPEPLIPRAAALLRLNGYLPLRPLVDSFYPSQHEIGYLEAGALVQYLVEIYGWEAFDAFYRDIHPAPSGLQSDAMDEALQRHFGLTLDQLEANFLAHLRTQPVDPLHTEDVRLSVQFYDTVRRYQQMFDPSAYFQTAWLADASVMRQKAITADYLRRPNGILNQSLENLLVEADVALRSGDYPDTAQRLQALNAILDLLENAK
jgi:hypothetical protein